LDENGEIIGSFTVIEDVAPRKRAENALRESETRYRTLFQSLKDLINMHSEMSRNESHAVGLRTLPDVSKNLEMNYIENALRKTKGKVQPAAKLLGISRFMLTRQMAKMKINGADHK
jgi:DNA-binding NtrC family response regulator